MSRQHDLGMTSGQKAWRIGSTASMCMQQTARTNASERSLCTFLTQACAPHPGSLCSFSKIRHCPRAWVIDDSSHRRSYQSDTVVSEAKGNTVSVCGVSGAQTNASIASALPEKYFTSIKEQGIRRYQSEDLYNHAVPASALTRPCITPAREANLRLLTRSDGHFELGRCRRSVG